MSLPSSIGLGRRNSIGTFRSLDAEHSYIFNDAHPDSKMYSYATTRPLKVLYFDGYSAVKIRPGKLDTQDVLAFKTAGHTRSRLDYDRARALCAWGQPLGLEGFLREEATFEIIWCDFSNGALHLVDTTPIGIPTPSQTFPPRTPYRAQEDWSWYHAAATHHRVQDKRITLDTAFMVTAYDPAYTSLAGNNKLPAHQRRLGDMSTEDTVAFNEDVVSAVTRWMGGSGGSGIDWTAIAQTVVDRNAGRLAELRHVLRKYTSSPPSNTTLAIAHVRAIAFAVIMPYASGDALSLPSTPTKRRAALLLARIKCTYAFTKHIPAPGTPQEAVLQEAVEGVLRRIANLAADVLLEALNLLDEKEVEEDVGMNAMKGWLHGIEELMGWLAWPEWERCETQCAWDVSLVLILARRGADGRFAQEQCWIPMWPIGIELFPAGMERDERPLEPRCIKMDFLLMGDLLDV